MIYEDIDMRRLDIDAITSITEAETILEILNVSIIEITDQIKHANADIEEGIDVDTRWKIKAETALRYRKKDRQRLVEKVAMMRREKKVELHRENTAISTEIRARKRDLFVKIAQEVLPPEQFDGIWRIAMTRYPSTFADEVTEAAE